MAPSTLSLISNMFRDDRQKTFAVSVWVASFSLGGAIGPAVGSQSSSNSAAGGTLTVQKSEGFGASSVLSACRAGPSAIHALLSLLAY